MGFGVGAALYAPAMTRSVLSRASLAAAVLAAGCLSRWSGCRSYDTGHLAGSGWTARVSCDPHTEVDLGGATVLRGCTARWRFTVERGRETESAELHGPRYPSSDCGEVRRLCASAHGELARRDTAEGTWVAARAPGAETGLAFVPSDCGRTYMLPRGLAPSLPPRDAVARQPDGPAFLDGVVAREPVTSHGWYLVCGTSLTTRVAAVRAAVIACRAPDPVMDALFRADPASVEVVWDALVGGRLSCADSIRRSLRESAATALGELVLGRLATCDARCPPRGRVELLREAGELRLPGVRDRALRLASPGPPPPLAGDASASARSAHRDAYDEWLSAQWALSRVDPQAGTELALATLRRMPVPEGVTRLPTSGGGRPASDEGDPATALCSIVLGDTTRARDGLWRLASDEGAGAGARQHALLALARLGDPRASGATLGRNPLTAEQAALVRGLSAPQGGTRSGGGHHHHWH